MKRKAVKEATLVRYLLGYLSEKERLELEKLYFADDDLYEALCVAEHELIDRYVYEELSRGERKRFESHFLAADSRRQKTRIAQELKQRFSTSEALLTAGVPRKRDSWIGSVFTRPVTAAFCFILVVGLAGIAYWIFYQSDVRKGMNALRKAYQNERPLEARISELGYAPWSSSRGGETRVDSKYQSLATSLLLTAVTEKPTSESHHATGRLYLANKQFNEAINEFEETLKTDPANAQLYSDLGAAFLEKGKRDRNAGDYSKSLNYLEKALELAPSSLEVLFNRALVLQQLGIYPQARIAWQSYIEKDNSSEWANEARRNLDWIDDQEKKTSKDNQQLLQEFLEARKTGDDAKALEALNLSRDGRGSYVVSELIDSYLQPALAGDTAKARDSLQALSYAGEVGLRLLGDPFTMDQANFYKSLSPNHLTVAARARELLNSANDAFFKSSRIEEARKLYEESRKNFYQLGGVTEASFIEYRMGHCYLRQTKPRQALLVFQKLRPLFKKQNYKWLLAQSFFFLADAHTGLGEYSRAIDYSSQALKLLDEIGDKKSAIKVLVQLADEYRFLGGYEKSLMFLKQGLDISGECSANPRDVWGLYIVMGLISDEMGFRQAALEYYKAALHLALEAGSPIYTSRSYAGISLLYAKLKNYDEALQNARYAYQIGENLSGESIGLNIMAYSSLQLGHIYKLTGDFDKALSTYDKVIELYDKLDFQAYQYEAHKAKFLTFFAQGDDSSAKEELRLAFKLLEDYRSKIYEESNTNSFFEAENSLYDIAIDFEYSRMNDPERAFYYAEAGRARSLFDMIQKGVKVIAKQEQVDLLVPSDSQPFSFLDLKGRMPERSQIVQYSVLNNKTIIWVISKGAFSHKEIKIDSDQLKEKVARYLEQVNRPPAKPSQDISGYARELYEILIHPVEELLDDENLICIVPDKFLSYLCFDTLVSSRGRMFIQEYLTQYCASAKLFVTCSEEAEKKADRKFEQLLSVGNPTFDIELFPRLADLQSATTEAKKVASYYQSPYQPPVVLTEKNAKEREVKSAMERSDVIHLAMHYAVEKQSPLLSRFVLAQEHDQSRQDSESDGVMQIYEIYKLNLSRARLIVLSACETGIERYFVGEGAIGAVRPFIAAKIPLIVCSLWPVDTASTADLIINFHKYRKQEESSNVLATARALRQAKLDMLASADEQFRQPYYWASFVAVGGYASF